MAAMASPKASRRVNEMKMPPTSRVGMLTRIERWSVLQKSVAADWMKNSSPPGARSWVIGGVRRVAVGGAPEGRAGGLDEERQPAGGEELVDRRARQDGRDDQQVHQRAEHRPDRDRAEAGEPERPAVGGHPQENTRQAGYD